MEQEELAQFIDMLELEKDKHSKARWFNIDEKLEMLGEYDKALQALKNIAYLQFDVEIE